MVLLQNGMKNFACLFFPLFLFLFFLSTLFFPPLFFPSSLVTDMDSVAIINFYQLGGKTKKKKKNEDSLLSEYKICVKDMVEGEMKREMSEIPWVFQSGQETEEKKRGLLYFHLVFEGDQTLAQYLPLEQLLMRDKFLILDCLCNTVFFSFFLFLCFFFLYLWTFFFS